MCQKIPFESRNAANHYVRTQNKINRGHNKDMRTCSAYFCEHCAAWHLTSMAKKIAKAKGYKRSKAA